MKAIGLDNNYNQPVPSCKLNQELIRTKSQPACFKSLSTRLNHFGTKATPNEKVKTKITLSG